MICPSKKKIFGSLETVQQYLAFQERQLPRYGRKAGVLYAYRCKLCPFYHLTSSAPTKDNPRYTAYKQAYKAEKEERAQAEKLSIARRTLINTLKRYLHFLRNPKDTQVLRAILAKHPPDTQDP